MCTATPQGPAMVKPEAGVSDVNLTGTSRDLIRASYSGETDAMTKALDAGADVTSADVNRRTALHFAAAHGLRAMCERLVGAGADVDAQDLEGYTALHMATGYKRVDTVRTLLKSGADANKATFNAAGDGLLAVEIAENTLEAAPKRKIFGFDMGKEERDRRQELVDILEEATELEDEDEEDEEGDDGETSKDEFEQASRALDGNDGTTVVVRKRDPQADAPPAPPAPDSDVKVTIRVRGKSIET